MNETVHRGHRAFNRWLRWERAGQTSPHNVRRPSWKAYGKQLGTVMTNELGDHEYDELFRNLHDMTILPTITILFKIWTLFQSLNVNKVWKMADIEELSCYNTCPFFRFEQFFVTNHRFSIWTFFWDKSQQVLHEGHPKVWLGSILELSMKLYRPMSIVKKSTVFPKLQGRFIYDTPKTMKIKRLNREP